MIRWVNDYNLVDRIYKGYRPTMPFKIKDVGAGVQAVEMEMTDIDYQYHQNQKQIKNDIRSIGGGKDLENHKRDILAECISVLGSKISKWQLFVIAFKKMFNFDAGITIKQILKDKV